MQAAPTKNQADLVWTGESLDVLQSWPSDIKQDLGQSLRQMQDGFAATLQVRPMPSIGAGVFELKTQDEDNWYRVIYLARVKDLIYILDCFRKDGRKTERKDLKTAGARLALVRQGLAESRKNEKRQQRKQ